MTATPRPELSGLARLGAETVRLDESPAELCAGGCGRPRPSIGSDSFVFRPAYCDVCYPLLLEREACEQIEQDAEEAKREQTLSHELLAKAIGPAYRGFTLASFPGDAEGRRVRAEAERWVSGYVSGDRRSLLLFGPAGTGKTGLAHGVALELIGHGFDVRAVVWPALLERLRSTVSRGGDLASETAPIRQAQVLVLDDLGTRGDPSGWVVEQAEAIVDFRHRQGLPTITTSNYTPDELAARFGRDDPIAGDRIASRLCDGAQQVRFVGIDRRVRLANVSPIERGRRP